MDLSVKITGVDTLVDRLSTLPDKVQRREARRAARAGAVVFRDAARRNFVSQKIDDPDTPENIEKNIAVRESRRQGKRAGGIAMRVGVLGGAKQYVENIRNIQAGRVGKKYRVGGSKKNPGGDTFYWRFWEFGTKKLRARPFMRPAFAQQTQAATDATALELSAGLDRLLP
jgi:HK97 gp10 family phage protein